MATELARIYAGLFAPEYFLLLCTLTLLLYERRSGVRRGHSIPQIGVIAAAWALAFTVYRATPILFERVPAWGADVVGGLGLALGFLLVRTVWKLRRWGPLVPEFAALLIALSVLHSIVTPVWDVSSHVIYTTAPAGYLSFVDRRFAPLLVVAAGMVVSRPLTGAHTWLQSVGGFVLASTFVLGLARLRSRGGATVGTRSSNREYEQF